ITVTVAAADDAPVISGVYPGMRSDFVSAAAATLTYTLSLRDALPIFNDQASTAGSNGYGSFELVGGAWTYTLDNATVQDLDAGDSVRSEERRAGTEGTTQGMTVTITGADDAPVVSGVFTGTLTEDGSTASGTLSISDVDGDDNPQFTDQASTAGSNGYGSFELVGGAWTYTLDNATVQDLDAGDSV